MLKRSPNGGIKAGADLHGDSQYFTIHSVINHTAGDFGDGDGEKNLQVLAEIIQQKVNLQHISVKSEVVDLSDAGERSFYGFGTNFNQAGTTVYTIKFLTEQPDFLSADVLLAMADDVDVPVATTVPATGGNVVVDAYSTDDAAAKNLSVTVFEEL